jgi:phthalate 4,5-dioxygenase oxygenase subunit
MLSQEENERLTRISAGTPMGKVMRSYWQPALLSRELPEPDGAPVRVRLLGEDLVAFRDTSGSVGIVDAFCPHRRAPMFFGRNEECGLRCVYHGWKFDIEGHCVDMPSEPPDSLFKTKVTIAAYPTHEAAGVIWVYMGTADRRPAVPNFEWMRAPQTHRFVSKTLERANWVQSLEGGLDSSHSSYLHNEKLGSRGLLRNRDGAPRLEVERTPYGYTYQSLRNLGDDRQYVRVYQYIMPSQQVRGSLLTNDGAPAQVPHFDGHLWVPIDDVTTWVWNFAYSYDENAPLTPEYTAAMEHMFGRGESDLIPGTFELKARMENDYFIDRARQKNQTFTGITGVNTQDMAVQEGMGRVVDRTQEHLGTSDRAIIAMRQLLLEAADAVGAGDAPRGSDPATSSRVRPFDGIISADDDWREAFAKDLLAKW